MKTFFECPHCLDTRQHSQTLRLWIQNVSKTRRLTYRLPCLWTFSLCWKLISQWNQCRVECHFNEKNNVSCKWPPCPENLLNAFTREMYHISSHYSPCVTIGLLVIIQQPTTNAVSMKSDKLYRSGEESTYFSLTQLGLLTVVVILRVRPRINKTVMQWVKTSRE